MKPYYDEDGITIYHGDCREMLSHLCFDVVITDPPYGISHPTNYLERDRGNLTACHNYPLVFGDDQPFDPRFLVGWPCVIWGANYFADKLPISSGWLVWDKQRPDDLDQSRCELAWSNFVKGVRLFPFLWHGMIRAGNECLEHPAQKPIALMKWCLQFKWCPEGTVLDPFMGSGTTLRAAKDLGRKAIGIEIEEKYCEKAATRLAQKVLDFK